MLYQRVVVYGCIAVYYKVGFFPKSYLSNQVVIVSGGILVFFLVRSVSPNFIAVENF